MTGTTTRSGLTLAFGAAVISGFAVFINGYGVKAVPDATVYTTAKNLVAAVVLAVIALVTAVVTRRTSPVREQHRPRAWAGLALVGVVGGSVPFVLFFEGLSRASSTHAAFLQKSLVVWVALLAVPLLGERLRAAHVLAIALLIGGLVVLDKGLAGFAMGTGEWLVLAATLLWSVEVVLAKRLLRGFSPATVAIARMSLGSAVLLGWVALSGRWHDLAAMSATGWTWAAATGVILAAYVATWFSALARAGAIDVTAILVTGAIITGLLNTLVKGVAMPATSALALCALAAGALIIAITARPAPVMVRQR